MTRNTLAATTCGVLLSALTLVPDAALAADLLPPPVPSYSGMSCLYARLNGGGTFYNRIEVTQNILDPQNGSGFGPDNQANALNEDLTEAGFIEGGLGCQVNDLLRVEVTSGYHFKSSLTDSFDTLSADYDNVTVFGNAFWDITNYGGLTPYIGGGIGMAINSLSNVSNPVDAADSTNTSFAWNVAAGMSYDISNTWTVDLAWRYTSFGELVSDGRQPFETTKLEANEVVLSLRYNFWTW